MSGYTMNDPRLQFDPQSHTYRLGASVLPSVTQILADVGISDFSQPWFTEDVRDRGSYMHAAILLDQQGDLDEGQLDPQLVPYLAGWRQFVMETSAEVEFCEQRLCDPVLGIAGTLDGIILLPTPTGRKRRVLIDLKRAFYPSAAIQLAAYQHMAHGLYDQPVAFERAVVELPGNYGYRMHLLTDPLDRSTWQAAVRIFQWRRENHVAA